MSQGARPQQAAGQGTGPKPPRRWVAVAERVALLIGVLVLLGELSLWMVTYNTPDPPEGDVVVAVHDLRAYQRLQDADLDLETIDEPVAGTVFTRTQDLAGRGILLRAAKEGEAVTAEAVVVLDVTPPTHTVLLPVPLPPGGVAAQMIAPGQSVIVVGTAVSNTVAPSTFATRAQLVQIVGEEAILAVGPREGAQLSRYLPPRGQVVILSSIDE
jgi:hypothetical protein